MRVLGIDLGSTRVGIAVGDTETGVATPADVLVRAGRDKQADRRAVADLVEEWEAERVIVGLPLSLDGSDGPAAVAAREEARLLSEVLHVPVILHDERLSTVSAHNALRETGMSGKERRKVIDAVAATVILQDWLDHRTSSEKTGREP